jgi:hypothetical protein
MQDTTQSATSVSPGAAGAGESASSSQPPSLLDKIQGLGFKDVTDEQAAIDKLIEDYQRANAERERLTKEFDAVRPFVQYGQEYIETLRKGSGQGSPGPAADMGPATSPQGGGEWWNPPKYDKSWAERYREYKLDPESGETKAVWRADTPGEVRVAHERYTAYVSDWADSLAHRPHEVLPPIIEQVARKVVEDYFKTATSQQTEEQYLNQQIRDNSAWLYEIDPRTNSAYIDPVTRQPRLSADGHRMEDLTGEAASLGITSLRGQWDYAKKIYDYEKQTREAQTQVQTQTVTQQATQKRQEHIKKVASSTGGSRSGSLPQPGESRPQNRNLGPGNKLLEQLKSDGVLQTA